VPLGRRPPRLDALGPQAPIPDKLYFKIGEVARLVGVHAHVLRYWEKEVPAIRPGKSVSNQRRYRHRDVELFREIHRLLYAEKYTLAGARRRLWGSGEASGEGGRSTDEGVATAVDLRSPETIPEPNLRFDSVADDAHRGDGVGGLDEGRRAGLRQGLLDLLRLVGEDS